ncbi:ribonuclease P protein subunit Rpp25 [Tachypleus tridentatus]|uniref:ribonuclease P protein subunit Rpp25 n=1 Tax=Tachypleus tridentatus TaxID=6853 RepID=UPI003FD17941
MENYTRLSRGKADQEDDRSTLPFSDLPENTIHIRVKAGSKLRNLLGFAMKTFKEENKRHMVIAGVGKAINKSITCAEIMKRKYKSLHQITKIGYKRVEELWEPKTEELDKLKVTREIPAMYILLCKDPLDNDELGYQAPGNLNSFWKDEAMKDKKQTQKKFRAIPESSGETRRQKFRKKQRTKPEREGSWSEGTKVEDV